MLKKYQLILLESETTLSRKEKKKGKRQVASAITSLTFAVGAFAFNAKLPPLMAWSHAFGAGALHQAARDFTGER